MPITMALIAAVAGAGVRIAFLQRRVRALESEAIRDPLTGAFNRRHMHVSLGSAIERRRRSGELSSVLMFDIDCFKRINDDFGHAEGDRVLKTVVALVGQRLRRLDALFRTGGEEFVLLLSGAGLTDAMSIAEEIRALVHDAGIGQARRLSISIGVAELSPEQSPEEWLVEADAALYRAKRDGRNRVAGWYGLPFRQPDSQTAHPISFRVRMS